MTLRREAPLACDPCGAIRWALSNFAVDLCLTIALDVVSGTPSEANGAASLFSRLARGPSRLFAFGEGAFPTFLVWRGGLPGFSRLASEIPAKVRLVCHTKLKKLGIRHTKRILLGNSPHETYFLGNYAIRTIGLLSRPWRLGVGTGREDWAWGAGVGMGTRCGRGGWAWPWGAGVAVGTGRGGWEWAWGTGCCRRAKMSPASSRVCK
jgi:hypothetical protein